MNFDSTHFTPLCFRSFHVLLFLCSSFLFFLVFVLFIEGRGQGAPTGSNIHTDVTLLREGAYTSSISVVSWINAADGWDDWFAG